MIGWHATTRRKLARYRAAGGIWPPVRFFGFRERAEAWGQACGRPVILKIAVTTAYPLPDHRPSGFWTPEIISTWEETVKDDAEVTAILAWAEAKKPATPEAWGHAEKGADFSLTGAEEGR